MKANLYPLQNRGMSRDMSVSKADNTLAWENHNIRVTARDHDTLLSVTNERGTKEIVIPEGEILGTLIGWNVLGNHIILFTTESDKDVNEVIVSADGLSVLPKNLSYNYEGGEQKIVISMGVAETWELVNDAEDADAADDDNTTPDHIYRIDYDGESFRMVCGDTDDDGVDREGALYGEPLFSGNLGFGKYHPIESIVSYEAANIQKIYWVDGKNVLRFMNFMETLEMRKLWNNTYFDSNRPAYQFIDVTISKSNGGNNRANGVAQYLITYYNEHGQETGYMWASDLVYLSPFDAGGSPDGTNANLVKLTISGLDNTFTHYKVYSLFRSSLNGEAVGYVIADNAMPSDGMAIVMDDGAPIEAVDVTSLLFLGGRDVIASTITEKDNTLFLGDITSVGTTGYDELEDAIHKDMFVNGYNFRYGYTSESSCVSFTYSDITEDGDMPSIPLEPIGGFYPYSSQLRLTSSQILSFKGGEKYRFALVFRTANGVNSKAFWIGDATNTKYPVMSDRYVRRAIAVCNIPSSVVNAAIAAGFVSATLMIAKADASDRNVVAQGIINPTMFNVWDRYKNRLYSYSSWITRPRHSGFASKHFEPVHNATTRTGELQCNYWDEKIYLNGKADSVFHNMFFRKRSNLEYDLDDPTPYYRTYTTSGTNKYNEQVSSGWLVANPSNGGYTHYMLVYFVVRGGNLQARRCRGGWTMLRAKVQNGGNVADYITTAELQTYITKNGMKSQSQTFRFNSSINSSVMVYLEVITRYTPSLSLYWDFWKNELYEPLKEYIDVDKIVSSSTFKDDIFDSLTTYNISMSDDTDVSTAMCMFYMISNGEIRIVTKENGGPVDDLSDNSYNNALRNIAVKQDFTWGLLNETLDLNAQSNKYRSSYYKKNLFFVDENVVTLNSPELEQESVAIDKNDGLKLRIVGVAKVVGNVTDYTIEASEARKSGENVVHDSFSTIMPNSSPDGLVAAPLYSEYGLVPLGTVPDIGADNTKLLDASVDSADYRWGTGSVWYWMYMWHKAGSIAGVRAGDGFGDDNEGKDKKEDDSTETTTPIYNEIDINNTSNDKLYSELRNKNYANLRFAYHTIYCTLPASYDIEDVRQYTYTHSQYVGLNVNGRQRSYNANVRQGLNMPTGYKYPVCFSKAGDMEAQSPDWYLGSDDQVMMSYKSSPHAVISLGAKNADGKTIYNILPNVSVSSSIMDEYYAPVEGETNGKVLMSNAMLPWTGNENSDSDVEVYGTMQKTLFMPAGTLSASDKYVFIGELYKDAPADARQDTRYGGISKSAVESNTFVTAGPQQKLLSGQDITLIGNQGDTYFQRWDCLKTKPYGDTEDNSVTDITSVMVETHINIDGRYDSKRNEILLSSMNVDNFGAVNPVYSQQNNFFAANDYGDKHTVDAYRSSITWTMEKKPSADVDAWSHITLASSLNLDGDKGVCRALRRFQNSILAFQDRGIAEVLFNSRTQIATTEGVPIEIANSGKVDGKRYISNKYGCINKWSIVEGKNGLYFIDNINKMIGIFNGEGITSLTSAAYLDIWMRDHNSLNIWNPEDNSNFVAYYDRIHSDVYFVGDDASNPCIVYNELFGNFTGFFDYREVPMMTNVGDKFVSFHKNISGGNSLWLQNEGLYNSFFGVTKPFYMMWRVKPDAYTDKIWGSIEYRADFFKVLSAMGGTISDEYSPTGGQRLADGSVIEGDYQPDMTFSDVEVWNEYQSTGKIQITWEGSNSVETYPDIRKKFRIWRADIPRAQKNESNIYGFDRIRNPWIWLKMGMSYNKLDNTCMMQLHDINIKYYTNE